MREQIEFDVKETDNKQEKGRDLLPPKKHGEESMWGHSTEVPRLIALRKAARRGFGQQEPFAREIRVRLTLCVYVGSGHEEKSGKQGSGDLDNFITGVCDGLMAAHENLLTAKSWHEDFDTADPAIHPRVSIAYEDDSQIREICAKKVVDPTLGDSCWYKVKLEEVAS